MIEKERLYKYAKLLVGTGCSFQPGQEILISAQVDCAPFVYVMLHKPAGLLSATEDSRQPTVLDVLPPELDEQDREILIAYYGDQIGYEELSKRLGIPVERCRVRVFRAKNRCRRLLENQENFSGLETKGPSETTRGIGGDPNASR